MIDPDGHPVLSVPGRHALICGGVGTSVLPRWITTAKMCRWSMGRSHASPTSGDGTSTARSRSPGAIRCWPRRGRSVRWQRWRWPQAGRAAARLAERAGGDPGPVRVDVGDAAAATIGFAVMRVDGESMARTNAENPWVGRYRCADGRWIHLHGGFPRSPNGWRRCSTCRSTPTRRRSAQPSAAWDSGVAGGCDRRAARLLGDHPHRGRVASAPAGRTRPRVVDRRSS